MTQLRCGRNVLLGVCHCVSTYIVVLTGLVGTWLFEFCFAETRMFLCCGRWHLKQLVTHTHVFIGKYFQMCVCIYLLYAYMYECV